MHALWRFLLLFTHKGPAAVAIVVSALMAVGGLYVSGICRSVTRSRRTGAARRFRYNRDVAYNVAHYSVSTDVFAIIVKTPADGCIDYKGPDPGQ